MNARVGWIVGMLVGLSSSNVIAQVSADEAAAAQLFEEAAALAKSGDAKAACEKFGASLKAARLPGTVLAVADCLYDEGRTASAWTLYKEALAAAHRSGRADREQHASERITALEPRLVHLQISLASDARIDGLVVMRDDVRVDDALLGSPLAVDPGVHVVRATAPGHVEWRNEVDVSQEGATQQATVPLLAIEQPSEPPAIEKPVEEPKPIEQPIEPPKPIERPAPMITTPPQVHDDEPSSTSHRRLYGALIAGAGVVAIGTGLYFGANASSEWDDAKAAGCTDDGSCPPAGVDLTNSALSDATISDIAIGVGVGALITGAIVWATAPSSGSASTTALHVAPHATTTGVSLILEGAF